MYTFDLLIRKMNAFQIIKEKPKSFQGGMDYP